MPFPCATRLDSAASAFFARDLEHIQAKIYEVKYPQLLSRTLIPVDSSAGDGVDIITTRQEDSVGRAKIITDYGDDLPRADVSGTEVSYPVKDIGISYGYSIREIKAALRASKSLGLRKAMAARKASAQLLDRIGQTGDSAAGLKGFLNNSLITPANVADPGAGTAWSTKTPAQILVDINDAVAAMVTTTKGVHSPTTLLLPLDQYTHIAQTHNSTASDKTILQFLLSTSAHLVEVLPWYALAGAGAAASDRMVVYDRSPDVLQLQVPVEHYQLPPQLRGLETIIPCRMVTGGVTIHRPTAVVFRDGI